MKWDAQCGTLWMDSELGHQIWSSWIGKPVNARLLNEIKDTLRHQRIWQLWCSPLREEYERENFIYPEEEPLSRHSYNALADQRRQSEERRRREEEALRVEQERLRAKQEADAKAEVLLLRHLSDKQKEDLATKGYFLVEVGGEIYKINRGFAGNIKLLNGETGEEEKSFCIHPTERVPNADAMLAQKLLLEADRDRFHKIANVTDIRSRRSAA